LASKRLININLVEISFALHFTKTIILNFISHLQYVFYLGHLSNLYYIMSDVKQHLNAKTSILGKQFTLVVTFDGLFLCLNVSFWAKALIKMSQNVTKLLILTTKIN